MLMILKNSYGYFIYCKLYTKAISSTKCAAIDHHWCRRGDNFTDCH